MTPSRSSQIVGVPTENWTSTYWIHNTSVIVWGTIVSKRRL